MSCENCDEYTAALDSLLRAAVIEKEDLVKSLQPLHSAIAALDTDEGRMNFVMSGPRAMAHIVQLYRDLPEELKVKK